MAQIEWLDSYYTHIDMIDEQHQGIWELINQLDKEAVAQNRAGVGEALNQLITAVITHFEFEEEFMAASGYGHLKAHKKLHDVFVEKLMQFSQRFDAGEEIADELDQTLQSWFGNHIEEDKDYSISAADEMNADKGKKKGWFARTFGE